MSSAGGRVLVVRSNERSPGPPPPGVDREQAFATDDMWAGFVRTHAGMASGWHHHGEFETVIYVLTGALRMDSAREEPKPSTRIPAIASAYRRGSSTARAILRASRATSSWFAPAPGSPPSMSRSRRAEHLGGWSLGVRVNGAA